jgi:excisionase family DNA binding protein
MNQLLDVNAVAALLSVSPYTIRAWVRQGKLNPVRLGRRVLFEMSSVEDFVREVKSKGQVDDSPAPQPQQ